MVEKRRRFTKEFKIEAVRLIVEEGRRISELSRELGVSENLLRNWKRKSEEGKIDPFPGKGRLSPEDDELRRLRRDNERLRIERDILKKSSGHLLSGTAMKYIFIRDHRGAFSVSSLCRTLEVGSSGFYAWLNRPESPRKQETRRLLMAIKVIHQKSRRNYGSPRIHAELNENGYACSRHRVSRLMRQHGIVSKHKRKFRVTTNSAHSYPIAENLLQRQFDVSGPGQCWVSDITYIPTQEGWLYLAITLDLFSRKVIGWSMGRWITAQLVIEALNMAIKTGCLKSGLIHHSDRGVQYASNKFQSLLKTYGIRCSMSRKGDCWDNAVAESFFHTLKVELIHGIIYNTRQEAKTAIFEYIEVFYNRQRRHSYLGYLSPINFEKKNAA